MLDENEETKYYKVFKSKLITLFISIDVYKFNFETEIFHIIWCKNTQKIEIMKIKFKKSIPKIKSPRQKYILNVKFH